MKQQDHARTRSSTDRPRKRSNGGSKESARSGSRVSSSDRSKAELTKAERSKAGDRVNQMLAEPVHGSVGMAGGVQDAASGSDLGSELGSEMRSDMGSGLRGPNLRSKLGSKAAGLKGSLDRTARFGHYLRRIREDRKLSLDAVEERAVSFPDRVTKSHLSRIETGRAIPSFPRLFTLSQIYGVPISLMAERFDLDIRRDLASNHQLAANYEACLAVARELLHQGDYHAALSYIDRILVVQVGAGARPTEPKAPGRLAEPEAPGMFSEPKTAGIPSEPGAEPGDAECDKQELELTGKQRAVLRGLRITCLLRLKSFHSAKEQAERILSASDLDPTQEVRAYYTLAICAVRLGRLGLAQAMLEKSESVLSNSADALDPSGESVRLSALLQELRGLVALNSERWADALAATLAAAKLWDELEQRFESARARLDAVIALIRLSKHLQANKMLDTLAELVRRAGYRRLQAIAFQLRGWLRYIESEDALAESALMQANRLARELDDPTLIFKNCYYLWKIAQRRNQEASIRTHLRTLQAFKSRIDPSLPEAQAFAKDQIGVRS